MSNRRVFPAFAILCAAIPTTLIAGTEAIRPPVSKVLDNGLRVLVQEMHTAPVAAVAMYYHVGSRNEINGLTGTSHFNEHMAFKASRDFAKGQLDLACAELGAENNAYTWYDQTAYYIKLPASEVEFGLQCWASCMAATKFKPEDFAAERIVVISELQGDEDNPSTQLEKDVLATAYKVHPYQWPVIGWLGDVQNVDRDAAYAYWRKYYSPNNCTLVISGDVEPDKVFALVEKHYGSIPARPLPETKIAAEPPQRGQRRATVYWQTPTAQMTLLWHVPQADHPDTPAIQLLTTILSEGRSSRLWQQLVETGHAVDAEASAMLLLDPCWLQIDAVLPAGSVDLASLEKHIHEQIRLLREQPVSDEELRRAKKQYKADHARSNESVLGRNMSMGDGEIIAPGPDGYRFHDDLAKKVQTVTTADIKRVAGTYLVEDNETVGWLLPSEKEYQFVGRQRRSVPMDVIEEADTAPPEPIVLPSPAKIAAGKPATPILKRELANGVTLIVCENHSVPLVSLHGALEAGSMFDPSACYGLASLTADCLDRGTKTRTSVQIAEAVENVGGYMGFGADKDHLSFYVSSLTEDFKTVLDVLADCLMNATFPEDEVGKSQQERLAMVKQRFNSTFATANRLATEALYGKDHPYGHYTLGYPDTIERLDRQAMVEFHKQYVRPDSCVIVISGDINADQAALLIDKALSGWKASGKIARPPLPPPTISTEQELSQSLAGKTQADFVYVLRGMDPSDARTALTVKVLNNILGGQFISRLNQEIRDKAGLAYYAYSGFDRRLGPGAFRAYSGTSSANLKRAMALMDHEIKRMSTGKFTDDELRRAKQLAIGGYLLVLDTNDGMAGALLEAEIYGYGLDHPWKMASIVHGITPEEVSQAARQYLKPEKLIRAVVGPKGSEE